MAIRRGVPVALLAGDVVLVTGPDGVRRGVKVKAVDDGHVLLFDQTEVAPAGARQAFRGARPAAGGVEPENLELAPFQEGDRVAILGPDGLERLAWVDGCRHGVVWVSSGDVFTLDGSRQCRLDGTMVEGERRIEPATEEQELAPVIGARGRPPA